ncbi:MAG: hypothetical protein M1482_07615 [Chloroflexi bacterium]|nr:hypothetical protein [Chloroflexota bacterium]
MPNRLPPPTQFTLGDKYRLLLAVLSLALGVVILARTLQVAISPPAILTGLAFVGFGLYRLWLGHTRLKQWNRTGR